MYRLKPGIKRDPVRRWALPDRAFFGHGACAILAGAYLSAPPRPGFFAERVVPGDGYAGNHIFVTDGEVAFDYHGYTLRHRLLVHHTTKWAGAYADGWTCRLERVAFDLLDRDALNRHKMVGPDEYLGDPVARAHRFIARFPHDTAHAGGKTA